MNGEDQHDAIQDDSGEGGDTRRYRVEAITRAARILSRLNESPNAGVGAIAESAGTTEAFARSALHALERHGLARSGADAPESWSLGLGWLRLAAAGRRQLDLREIAQPVMRRMRDDVDETIILAIRQGVRRVNIDYVESTQEVRRMTRIGDDTPLYLGAAGRALLSGFSDRDLRDYLVSVSTSDGKVISGLDVEAYTAQVAAVRERGYATTRREFSSDLCAISTPVRDHAGQVVAALTISCPADRFTEALELSCARVALEGALEVSRLIGFAGASTRPDAP